ncbi:radical SAM protein [Candidatus Bipolaricaulota bacterium]|nr:radical SAM protein [Candidatus Bipolaricaulota bacterium]
MKLSSKDEKYFRLNGSAPLIKGKNRSAIYNLGTGDIIHLTPKKSAILETAQQNKTIMKIVRALGIKASTVKDSLKNIADRDMGKFYRTPTYIENFKKGWAKSRNTSVGPTRISQAFVRLTNDCKSECKYCSFPRLYSCLSCTRKDVKDREVNFNSDMVFNFLTKLTQMPLDTIVFHGGDPLLKRDRLITMIEFCRNKGFSREISFITNGTLLNHAPVDIFRKYNVHPIITFFSRQNKGITKEKLVTIGKRLMNKGVEFTVTLTYFAEGNCIDAVENLKNNFLLKEGIQTQQSVIMNNGPFLSKKVYEILVPQLFRVTPDLFLHNKLFHPCLDKSISLEMDGSLSSCPFLPSEALINIRDSRAISRMFESNGIFEHWRLNLSKVEKCRHCEFRYGCIDCRALGKTLTSNLYGKNLCLGKSKTKGGDSKLAYRES